MDDDRRALLISGTVGAGKTTTAEAVGELLAAAGVPHAVVDLDGLRRIWPPPPGDPFAQAVGLANLRAVAATAWAAGARRLVLAGVVEEPAAVAEHADAVGAPVDLCRLRLGLAAVRERLRRRHALHEEDLRWHLHRAGELEAVLDAAALPGAVLDVDGLSPEEVAAAVVRAAGWADGVTPGAAPPRRR